jgi:hypothetical protein
MAPEEYTALVRFLGDRFDIIDRRFERIDRPFEGIDRRFDELRADILGHFDALHHRLERVEQEYAAVPQALPRIEGSRS